MTLQASGQIDMSDINVELGLSGTAQIALGGAGPRGLAGVASGVIRLGADFYGKSNFAVNASLGYIENLSLTTVAPRITFDTNGDVYVRNTITNVNIDWTGGNWGNPLTTSIGAGYDLYWEVTSGNGTMGGDATATWLNLGTLRQFTISVATAGQARNRGGNWYIRPAGGGSNLASGTWYLESDRTGG